MESVSGVVSGAVSGVVSEVVSEVVSGVFCVSEIEDGIVAVVFVVFDEGAGKGGDGEKG